MFTRVKKRKFANVRFVVGGPAALMMLLIMISSAAQAQYDYELIVYPGAISTNAFGINDKGDVAGNANLTGVDGDGFGYEFDPKSGTYTEVTGLDSVLGINKHGELVGDLVDGAGFFACAMQDKKGVVTTFYPPSWSGVVDPNLDFCQARGISHSGEVTGFVATDFGTVDSETTGFVYDSKKDTYEEFLTSRFTIPQGINKKDQIVGSVILDSDEAYPGSPPGRHGFLREKNGDVKYFTVNGISNTAGRGISDSGDITGWYVENFWWGFVYSSFVIDLSEGTDFENVDVPADELIAPDSCNLVAAEPPPDWTRVTDVIAQAIQKDGVIAGQCQDFDILFDPPGDLNGAIVDGIAYDVHGFVATPQCDKSKKSKKSKKSGKC